MAEKTKQKEPKLILEREYIVPLRMGWLKVAKYKRANKAVKTLKEFIAKHMKIYDRDLRKIKIDNILNNEIRFRGMRKPLAKVKVLAKKYDDDTVLVQLINVPKHIEFARLREEKRTSKIKPVTNKVIEEEVKKETEEKKEETLVKEEASKEETLKIAKEQAKEMKHTAQDKKVMIRRKALSR